MAFYLGASMEWNISVTYQKGGIDMGHKVITIAREFGSGGRAVGEKLAEKLGMEYYDKKLISLAAQKSGIREDLFENADEQPTNSLLYSLAMGAHSLSNAFFQYDDTLTNDKLFLIQSDIIRSLAREKSCVIVGRCADYLLRDEPYAFSVFIHADYDTRLARVQELYQLSPSQAKDLIKRTDKKRKSYVEFYTSQVWGAAKNYDLSLNSSLLGIDGTVDLIAELAEHFRK